MESFLHNIADLPDAARSAVEAIVGHPLPNNEMLYIATFGIQAEPSPADLKSGWDEVEAIIAQSRRNAQATGLSSDQIDKLIDDESAAVRYGNGQ